MVFRHRYADHFEAVPHLTKYALCACEVLSVSGSLCREPSELLRLAGVVMLLDDFFQYFLILRPEAPQAHQ
jgi:hypothetical protein